MNANTSDLNLLFAVLALQNGLVEKDELLKAMNAWGLEKHRPIGDILQEHGALHADDRQLLDGLVARQLRRHGSAEKSLADAPVASSLKEQLRSLCHPEMEASVARLGGDPHATRASTAAPADGGTRYRILRPHAKGGLGEVFVAEDTELHRPVALKEIQCQHADSESSRGRFVLEAEITGGLEHPGIVPVYGLGAYADGRPFYAMRFIRGDNLKEAIARFHGSRQGEGEKGRQGERDVLLSPSPLLPVSLSFQSLEFRQLLGRFIDVCNAVAYAHSRGVLHRDLKPGNVMLGKFGETLVVDWGLAKARGERLGARDEQEGAGGSVTELLSQDPAPFDPPLRPTSTGSSETVAGSAIGTPQYMSPEQAAGKIDELGPATDIYSLGATLYTLLTNRPPVVGSDTGAILRDVQRGDAGFARGTEGPFVPRPLVAICKKAMAPRPADRYATPLALAEELEHWLADDPVSVYPEPVAVRTRRWLRKHPGPAAAVAAAVLVGVVGLTIGAILLGEKNRQLSNTNEALATANQKLDTANVDLKTTNEELDAANRNLNTTNKRLDAANLELKKSNENLDLARKDAEERRQQAEDEKQVAFAVRRFVLHDLLRQADPTHQADRTLELDPGRFTTVENPTIKELLDRAAADLAPERIEHAFPGQPRVQAEILGTVGLSYLGVGDFEKAVPHLERSRLLYEKTLGPDHVATLASMHNLASSYQDAGKLNLAVRLFEETLRLTEAKLGQDHYDTMKSMNNLALCYVVQGKSDLAVPLYEKTLKFAKARLGPDHQDTLTTMGNLALGYLDLRKLDLALPLLEETLALRKAKLGPAHPHTLISMDILAQGYHEAGKLDLAVPLLEESLKLSIAKLGRLHPGTLVCMNNLARSYGVAGRLDLAVPLLEETLKLQKAKRGLDHPDTLTTMNNLASAYHAAGKFELALPLFEQTLNLRTAKLGSEHPHTLLSMGKLAYGLQVAGKLDLAVPLYEKTLKVHQTTLGLDHPDTLLIMHNMAGAYRSAQKFDLALPLYEETFKLRKARLGSDHPDTLGTMNNLASAYHAAGKLDLAVPLYEETFKLMKAKLGADHPRTLNTMANVGAAYLDAKQPQKALPLFHDFLAGERRQRGANDMGFGSILAQVSQALLKAKQYPEAEKCLRECLAINEKNVPDAWITFNTRAVLGGALLAQKKYADAEPLLLGGYEGLKQRAASIPPQIKDAWLNEAVWQLVQLFEATRTKSDVKLAGALSDQKTEAGHEIKLTAGKPVVIDMRSRRFDTYLRLEDAKGTKLDEHDDIDRPGKNLNSRILLVPTTDGVYRVIAASPDGRGRGDYEIIVRAYSATKAK